MRVELPAHLVRSRAALDYWEHQGQWDHSGIDWYTVAQQPGHPLRTALINGQLASFVFTEAGALVEIPPPTWGGFLWGEAYETSVTRVRLRAGVVIGYLCIVRAQWLKRSAPVSLDVWWRSTVSRLRVSTCGSGFTRGHETAQFYSTCQHLA